MVVRGKPVHEKVADWFMAFEAIRVEITPSTMREVLAAMKGADTPDALASVERLARMISANDRAAAIAAAMITSTGIRSVTPDMGDLDDSQ